MGDANTGDDARAAGSPLCAGVGESTWLGAAMCTVRDGKFAAAEDAAGGSASTGELGRDRPIEPLVAEDDDDEAEEKAPG